VKLDITSRAGCAALVAAERPDAILLAAAYTHVDGCESQAARAQAMNVEGVANVLAAAEPLGCTMAYYSTDYLFDGKEGPYTEDAVPNPLGVYARTKLEGENLVKAYPHRWLSLRITHVFGYEPAGKNFSMKVLACGRKGEPIRAPIDQISTPTYAPDIGESTLDLLEGGHRGVFNIAGEALMGRVAFGRLILGTFGLNMDLMVPLTTAELGQAAPRPLRAGLLADKLRAATGRAPRAAGDALLDMRDKWADYEAGWGES
jgi:dTDP-4-dehydrorhamnose reductase